MTARSLELIAVAEPKKKSSPTTILIPARTLDVRPRGRDLAY